MTAPRSVKTDKVQVTTLAAALRASTTAVPGVLSGVLARIDSALAKGDGPSLAYAVVEAAEALAIAGRVSDASHLAQLALDYGTSTGLEALVVEAKARLAKAARVGGDLRRARSLLDEVLAYYKHQRPLDHDALADTYISLGLCAETTAERALATHYLRVALRHASKARDPKQWEILARMNLANAYRRLGRHGRAEQLFSQALGLAASVDSSALVSTQVFLDVADACLRAGRIADATTYAERAASVADQANLRQLEARAMELQGEIAARQGNHAEAVSRYDRGLAIAQDLGLKKRVADLMNLSGTCRVGPGNFTPSLSQNRA